MVGRPDCSYSVFYSILKVFVRGAPYKSQDIIELFGLNLLSCLSLASTGVRTSCPGPYPNLIFLPQVSKVYLMVILGFKGLVFSF